MMIIKEIMLVSNHGFPFTPVGYFLCKQEMRTFRMKPSLAESPLAFSYSEQNRWFL